MEACQSCEIYQGPYPHGRNERSQYVDCSGIGWGRVLYGPSGGNDEGTELILTLLSSSSDIILNDIGIDATRHTDDMTFKAKMHCDSMLEMKR